MNEPLEELLIFYAIGGLTDKERERVEAYLEANPQAPAELKELARIPAILRAEITPVSPSPETKAHLMARIQTAHPDTAAAKPATAPTSVSSFSPSWLERWSSAWRGGGMSVYALASIVIIALLGVWAFSLNKRLTQQRREIAVLSTRTAALEDDLTQQETAVYDLEAENRVLRQALQQQETVLALFSAPNVHTVTITGTEERPQATGLLLIQAGSNDSYLYVTGLERLPEDSIYQFWLVGDEGPVGAGIFNVHEDGTGVLQISSDYEISNYTAAGVSVEPAGGSPQPTGYGVLRGSLSS